MLSQVVKTPTEDSKVRVEAVEVVLGQKSNGRSGFQVRHQREGKDEDDGAGNT